MKLLLGCKKIKPYLYYNWTTDTYETTNSLKDLRGDYGGSRVCSGADRLCAYQDNGKILTNDHIMAECDFEVEEIKGYGLDDYYATNGDWLIIEKGLGDEDINKYLKGKDGYAIHIKNLHIFDVPRNLEDYVTWDWVEYSNGQVYAIPKKPLTKLTRMTKVMSLKYDSGDYAISLSPEEMCRVLNGKQTIIVRRTILKEMLEPTGAERQ